MEPHSIFTDSFALLRMDVGIYQLLNRTEDAENNAVNGNVAMGFLAQGLRASRCILV
jgi:hypothetical protein